MARPIAVAATMFNKMIPVPSRRVDWSRKDVAPPGTQDVYPRFFANRILQPRPSVSALAGFSPLSTACTAFFR